MINAKEKIREQREKWNLVCRLCSQDCSFRYRVKNSEKTLRKRLKGKGASYVDLEEEILERKE